MSAISVSLRLDSRKPLDLLAAFRLRPRFKIQRLDVRPAHGRKWVTISVAFRYSDAVKIATKAAEDGRWTTRIMPIAA
jgi:hypothetical protein